MERSNKIQYLAHVRQDSNGGWKEHPLEEHLQEVHVWRGNLPNHLKAESGLLWLGCGTTWENTQQAFRTTSGQPAVMRSKMHVEMGSNSYQRGGLVQIG